MEFIENKKITKQNKNEWYHPCFHKNNDGIEMEGHKLKYAIASCAAKEGLVPLYNVYDSIDVEEKSLLEYTLEHIAKERVGILKAEVADGKRSTVELLSATCPEIQELLESPEINQEQIVYAWSNLATKWAKDFIDYLRSVLQKEIHVIQLPSNEIGRATSIYESINKGGISLNEYDLIVARAAKIRSERSLTHRIIELLSDDIELSEALLDTIKGNVNKKWSSKVMRTVEDNKLTRVIRDQYLNLLSIFSHTSYGEFDTLKIDHIKKNKILEVSVDDINVKTPEVINSIIRASAFLQFRCGKRSITDLNYRLMLLPIAYALRDTDVWENRAKLGKIEFWYWSSLFGGAYRELQNQRCIDDIENLYKWINEEIDNPFAERCNRILKVEGYSNLDVLLFQDTESNIPTAIHNGILEYIMSTQAKDFNPDMEIFLNAWDVAQQVEMEFSEGVMKNLKVEDHHIYPLGATLQLGESSKELRKDKRHILNSPLNRTYISSHANSLISNRLPQDYFKYIENIAQWGHCIPNNSWEKDENETQTDFYKRLLTVRYELLIKEIHRELDNLKMLRK